MSSSIYAIVFAMSIFSSAVAVFLQRRLPDKAIASHWVSLAFVLIVGTAYWLATGHAPPLPWTEDASAREPWEFLLVPWCAVALLTPSLPALANKSPAVALWLAMFLGGMPILASLPSGPIYVEFLPGNALWSMSAMLSIGANYLAGQQMSASGANRWVLWVFVAQLFTVAALILTCYGTLGELCVLAAISLTVMAVTRAGIARGSWACALPLLATMLSCTLLTHFRVYSSPALPIWLAPLALLSPVVVCGVDQACGAYRSSLTRLLISAVVATIVASIPILTVLLPAT